MIYITGIAITLFLSLILFTKKNKNLSDKILLGWLIVVLIHLALFVLISSKEYIQFPQFLGFEIPLPLLHGPILFLYTKSLTDSRKIRSNIWLHFIPFLIAFTSIVPFLLLDYKEKINVYQNEGIGYTILTTIIFTGTIASGVFYSVLSLLFLRRYQKRIKDKFSYIDKINLQWLFGLIIGLSLIWAVVLFANEKFIFSTVVFYVLFIGYFGIKQVGIFTNQPPAIIAIPKDSIESLGLYEKPIENPKYEKSSLTNSELEAKHSALVHLMKEKKLYLTPELTLANVAEELGEHANILSQVINRVEKRNFFDYINKLRVEEFKEKVVVPDNQKFTLLSLAYECGFNSKTSFNRNFKGITGKSPSEYLIEINVTLK